MENWPTLFNYFSGLVIFSQRSSPVSAISTISIINIILTINLHHHPHHKSSPSISTLCFSNLFHYFIFSLCFHYVFQYFSLNLMLWVFVTVRMSVIVLHCWISSFWTPPLLAAIVIIIVIIVKNPVFPTSQLDKPVVSNCSFCTAPAGAPVRAAEPSIAVRNDSSSPLERH